MLTRLYLDVEGVLNAPNAKLTWGSERAGGQVVSSRTWVTSTPLGVELMIRRNSECRRASTKCFSGQDWP